MSKKRTQEEYVNEVAIKNQNVEVIGQYVDAKTPILHRCLIHNVLWNVRPYNVLHGCGCKMCGKMKIGNHLKKTDEQYKEELSQINPNIEIIGKYIDSNTPILHKCLKDGYMWNTAPNNTLRGHGCPLCANNIKKTTEQYVIKLHNINPNIEVIGDYINAQTPICHKCKIDGYEWYATPTSTLSGNGCAMCAGNAKKTTDDYKNELANINPNIIVIEAYISSLTPILHKCKIDGNEWKASPANILHGQECPECIKRMLSKKFSKSHEQYVKDVANINADIEVIGEYISSRAPILHRCKIDGCVWMVRPHNILSGKGCPHCKESQGEKQIRVWLNDRNIEYKYQYPFEDCKDKKMLPFDFYLPTLNLCIEYDGVQHFEPIDFAGRGDEWALSQLKMTQLHDKIKTNYCQDNNIALLRIPYFANIKEELEKFFIHLI